MPMAALCERCVVVAVSSLLTRPPPRSVCVYVCGVPHAVLYCTVRCTLYAVLCVHCTVPPAVADIYRENDQYFELMYWDTVSAALR